MWRVGRRAALGQPCALQPRTAARASHTQPHQLQQHRRNAGRIQPTHAVAHHHLYSPLHPVTRVTCSQRSAQLHQAAATNPPTPTPAKAAADPATAASPDSSASASSSPSPSPSSSPPKSKRTTLKTLRYDLVHRVNTHLPGVNHWAVLVKSELSIVVTMSSLFGCILVGLDAWSLPHALANFVGTAMCASSAAIGNQYLETKYDALMPRTMKRPLVTGTISTQKALTAMVLLPVAGAALLHYASAGNLVAPALGVGTIVAYTCIYTPLKRIHRWNTELGAIIGAVPVLIGWSCAISHWMHHMTLAHHLHFPFTVSESMLLPHAQYGFWFLVAWQMQHFMTIAFIYEDQYPKGGYVMMRGFPALHKGMAWTAVLCAMPFAGVYFGVASQMLLVTGSAINSVLVYFYYRWWRTMRETTDDAARKQAARVCLKWGILYFLVMFTAVCYHSLDNKYHLFTSLVPRSVRERAFLLCPVAWRTTPVEGGRVVSAQEVAQFPTDLNPSLTPCKHDHSAASERACVYMRLIHHDQPAAQSAAQAIAVPAR